MDPTEVSEHFARRGRVVVTIALLGVAGAVWVGSVRSFTAPAYVTTGAPALVVFASAARTWRSRPARDPASDRRGTVVWIALVVTAIAWELLAYAQAPRSLHPTLSSMLDVLGSARPLRALLFGLWLALGWELSRS
jgi:hypothetical protein